MVFLGIGPRGESRNSVDLAQEAADKLVTVLALTECAHFRVEAAQRRFDVDNDLLGVVLTLALEALPVLKQLLAIEVSAYRTAQNWGARDRGS